ncbi:hypothetical protein K1719_010241 [Acacia pycnantha]|nr:hypothetical protein K1719_010241 [Acacia pycnantha]
MYLPGLSHTACSFVAAFSGTRLFKTLKTIPNNVRISGITSSTAPLQMRQSSSGVSSFKRYLDFMGFIHDHSNMVADIFSSTFRSVLENFQRIYNVLVTGMLDNHTVEQMKRPRRGFPDVISGTSTKPALFSWSCGRRKT